MTTIETIYPNKEVAEKVVRELFAQKLIAYALFSEVTSMFPKEGELREEEEIYTTVKLPDKFERIVCEYIEKTHPYEVPMIGILKTYYNYDRSEAESSYSRWVDNMTA